MSALSRSGRAVMTLSISRGWMPGAVCTMQARSEITQGGDSLAPVEHVQAAPERERGRACNRELYEMTKLSTLSDAANSFRSSSACTSRLTCTRHSGLSPDTHLRTFPLSATTVREVWNAWERGQRSGGRALPCPA